MLVRQLTKQLSRSLNTALSGIADAITKVLIDLSPTSNGFYSLGTPITFAGDFEIEVDFSTTSTSAMGILGAVNDSDEYIRITNGYIKAKGSTGDLSDTSVQYNDGKLHTLKVVSSGSTTTSIYVDNSLLISGSFIGSIVAGFLGKYVAGSFSGIISDVKLTDLTTPANSLVFNLDQLTANTETNNGVVLTYQNIGTGTDVRDTYTLSNGDTQWISDLRTIDIAAQA